MRASVLLATIGSAAMALASALPLEERAKSPVCSGLGSTPLCCATDVLGTADLDCAKPPKKPRSIEDFTDICADIGQRARCCVLPVLGQGLICTGPG